MTDTDKKIAEIIEKLNAKPSLCTDMHGFDEELGQFLEQVIYSDRLLEDRYGRDLPFKDLAITKLEQALRIYFSPLNEALR